MVKPQFIKVYKRKWVYRIIALIACMVTIIALIAFGIFNYYNNKNNPVIVKTLEDYTKALNNDSYIQISCDNLYDIDDATYKAKAKLGTPLYKDVNTKFIAIQLDPFILAVHISEDEFKKLSSQKNGPYVLKGTLVEFEDNELKTLKQALNISSSFANENRAPYLQYLKCETPLSSVSLYFTIAAGFFAYTLLLYILIMRKNVVALKSLKNFSYDDFETTCRKIDYELNLPDAYKNGPVAITQNYITVQSQKIVFALPSRELMWVYKQTVKKKAFFVIPAGKINNLIFVFSDKTSYSINSFKSETAIDETINYICKNRKICFVGYNEELKKLFEKDFEEFMFRWQNIKIQN